MANTFRATRDPTLVARTCRYPLCRQFIGSDRYVGADD